VPYRAGYDVLQDPIERRSGGRPFHGVLGSLIKARRRLCLVDDVDDET